MTDQKPCSPVPPINISVSLLIDDFNEKPAHKDPFVRIEEVRGDISISCGDRSILQNQCNSSTRKTDAVVCILCDLHTIITEMFDTDISSCIAGCHGVKWHYQRSALIAEWSNEEKMRLFFYSDISASEPVIFPVLSKIDFINAIQKVTKDLVDQLKKLKPESNSGIYIKMLEQHSIHSGKIVAEWLRKNAH